MIIRILESGVCMALVTDGETTQNSDIQLDFELPESVVGINVEDRDLYLTIHREFGDKIETDYIAVQNNSYIVSRQPQGTIITIIPEFVKSGYAAIRCTPVTLQVGVAKYEIGESQILPDKTDARDIIINNIVNQLKNKADKTSPIINNKLIVQTGEASGATPTVPYLSVFPIIGGACIRYGEGDVMTPTFKITESGLIYNQDGDDYKVYAENNKPPMDAAMINVPASAAVFDCSKTRIIKVKSANHPPKITIQNAYAGCRGAVYVPDGAPYILFPAGSKKAANRFDDDSTGGPLLYEFFYDGTTYWWTCTKYNNA